MCLTTSGAKHYHDGPNITEATQEGAVDGVKAGATSSAMGGVTTVGKVKFGNYKSIKSGNADEIISNKDALFNKSAYSDELNMANSWKSNDKYITLGLTKKAKRLHN